MLEAEPCFGSTQAEGFSVYASQRIFAVRTEAFGDVVLMPGEKADRFADRNKFQAQLHLPAEPSMVAHHAVLSGVRVTFPDFTAVQKRASLDRHMPIGIDGAGNGDLVEEVEEVELLIEHDRGAEDSISTGFFESLDRVI